MRFPLLVLTTLLVSASPVYASSTQIFLNKQQNRQPEVVAPKINTPGWAASPYITPDGRALYFMYSRYNFFPTFEKKGPPALRGPMRLGHNSNDLNPYMDYDLYVARRKADGTWKTPSNILGVNDRQNNCCAMFSAGKTPVIYSQVTTVAGDTDLMYRQQDNTGMWSEAIPFPRQINTRYNEENVHVSADRRRVYFTSDRPGGYGDKDIWFAYTKGDGQLSIPANLGPMINTKELEDQFWMADIPDAKGNYDVYFNRTAVQIWHTTWNEKSGFATPEKVDLGVPFASEASVTADGQELYFSSPDPATETMRIMVSRRTSTGAWAAGQPVD